MKLINLCIIFFVATIGWNLDADPMIRSVKNTSDFVYTVIGHNDRSDCSLFNAGKVIEIQPHSLYEIPFLLGFDKPGLVLRPTAFYDKNTKEFYSFVDENNKFDQLKIEEAFYAWEKSTGKKYKNGFEHWFKHWLCGDIVLIHNHVEMLGYLSHAAFTLIENNENYHACIIDYSEGLFSRLLLDITIKPNRKKGIIPDVKSFVGKGGLCQDGQIIALR